MRDFSDQLKPHPQSDGASTLSRERAQSPLDTEEISVHLFGRDEFLERQGRVLAILEYRYRLGLARAKVLRRLSDKHGWSIKDDQMASYLVDEVSPYHLHVTMFGTCVREQGSEEQKEYWLPRIDRFEIIGAYSQTELGHGSNVRGLELEARYNRETREFVLHSPYLTACKWWNGTLGRTANHAIVMAQLLLPGHDAGGNEYVSHGAHPFIVQIRDLKTHQPLDGIIIGDIGPKYGYWSMDNGYMLFDKFRIPHSALLNRYAKVDPETGVYSKPERPEVLYGTMTFVRSEIVLQARMAVARVATVAIRYCTIRRQFHDRDEKDTPGGTEMAVIDYPTVQFRIFPLLATAFALHYAGSAMWDLYWQTRGKIEKGDFGQLADLHSKSSGLKSLCTTLAADSIEIGRRALGGHGFGAGSGLISLNNDYHSRVTVEGDNYMITQQVARYLLKKATAAQADPNSISTDDTDRLLKDHLRRCQSPVPNEPYNILEDDKVIPDAFAQRAAFYTFKAHEARIIQKRPWNSLLIQFYKLSNAVSQATVVATFYEGVKAKSGSSLTKAVLLDLFRLFAFVIIEKEGREFSDAGAVSKTQLDALQDKIQEVMLRIRPHAVKIVDAWKIPDYLLDSALGRYDGKVYEELFDRAHRQNPLNSITFNPNYWEDELEKGSNDGGLNGKIVARL